MSDIDFLWTYFDDEIYSNPRSYMWIASFFGDEGIINPLTESGEFNIRQALMVLDVDTDLRLPPESPKSKFILVTIEVE